MPKRLLGTRLRKARCVAKVSQEHAADMLGVTRQSVSSWERGQSCPSALQIAQLSTLYCVCAHTLLFGEAFKPLSLGAMIGRAAAQTSH